MKRQGDISHNDYGSNYSFKGSDDKPLNELFLNSLIPEIDQTDFQPRNPYDYNQNTKQEITFNSHFDQLTSNLTPNHMTQMSENSNNFKFITPTRTKFKSDNNIGNNRMPMMGEFQYYHQQPRNNVFQNLTNGSNNNYYPYGNNNANNFQGNFSNYPCNTHHVPNFGNPQYIGKNVMFQNNNINQVPQGMQGYMMGNHINQNVQYQNNHPNLGGIQNHQNVNGLNNIPLQQYNYNNNNFVGPIYQQKQNYSPPIQIFDHQKINSLNQNTFVSGNNSKVQNNNNSKSTSPITSTNVSVIEEGLNNFHFSRPQRKFLSADQLTSTKQHIKRKSFIPDEFDKKNVINEEYTDIQEILSTIDTKLSDYIRTQKGSRNMQKMLNKITPDVLDTILQHIGDSLPELMVDPYSNYFCQKLAQCCSSEQRIYFLRKIQKDFTAISCNKKGTYALQGIIEIINLEDEEQIIRESIENSVIFLCLDNNGTHVIQKLISCIDEDKRDYINNQIISNLLKLVLDANGICIAKSFIASNVSLDIRKRTLEAILLNCLEILQNPFGNYVIQEVFDKWGFETCKEIAKVIHLNIISLSMQKYSSNVVEKSIEIADSTLRRKVLKDLLGSNKITSLLKNKFGNFVLQKAISFIKVDEALRAEIKENISKKLAGSNNKDKAKLTTLLEML